MINKNAKRYYKETENKKIKVVLIAFLISNIIILGSIYAFIFINGHHSPSNYFTVFISALPTLSVVSILTSCVVAFLASVIYKKTVYKYGKFNIYGYNAKGFDKDGYNMNGRDKYGNLKPAENEVSNEESNKENSE